MRALLHRILNWCDEWEESLLAGSILERRVAERRRGERRG